MYCSARILIFYIKNLVNPRIKIDLAMLIQALHEDFRWYILSYLFLEEVYHILPNQIDYTLFWKHIKDKLQWRIRIKRKLIHPSCN